MVGWQIATFLDRGLQRGEERLARTAIAQVLLQFIAERIIELFIEIIGELREHGFAGSGPWRLDFLLATRYDGMDATRLRLRHFVANEQPRAMQANANRAGP